MENVLRVTQEEESTEDLSEGISVFISSSIKQGEQNYLKLRSELQDALQSRSYVRYVYVFENGSASTLSSKQNYLSNLQDCDVCIFLIDNKDGIAPGTQEEIDEARKQGKKSIFLFCDQKSKAKTSLQKELINSAGTGEKFRTVHSFSRLKQAAVDALESDVRTIYHLYCTDRLQYLDTGKVKALDAQQSLPRYSMQGAIANETFQNIDACTSYFYHILLGNTLQVIKSSELDKECAQFLPILFEPNCAHRFSLFPLKNVLQCLEGMQEKSIHDVVHKRWRVIEDYFNGDLGRCEEELLDIEQFAVSQHVPNWLVKDITLDRRSICAMQMNTDYSQEAWHNYDDSQKSLESLDDEPLYYPVMDRQIKELQEKYLQKIESKQLESPYTVTLGENLTDYARSLASIFIVAMYYGSLTYLKIVYQEVLSFFGIILRQYDNWHFLQGYLSYTLILKNRSEAQKAVSAFPALKTGMTAVSAREILDMARVLPLESEETKTELAAITVIGDYLDDAVFAKCEKKLFALLDGWRDGDRSIMIDSILESIKAVEWRLSQRKLAEECVELLKDVWVRMARDLFTIINRLDFDRLEAVDVQKLSSAVLTMLRENADRGQENKVLIDQLTSSSFSMILTLRKHLPEQDQSNFDQTIHECLPTFYQCGYLIECSENPNVDWPGQFQNLLAILKQDNVRGISFSNSVVPGYLLLMVSNRKFDCGEQLLTQCIDSIAASLLRDTDIRNKITETLILSCIASRYPGMRLKCQKQFEQILTNRYKAIELCSQRSIFPDPFPIALRFAFALLRLALGKRAHSEMLDVLSHLPTDERTVQELVRTLDFYLEAVDQNGMTESDSELILMILLQWLQQKDDSIRQYSLEALIQLLHFQKRRFAVNQELKRIYRQLYPAEKCLILRNLYDEGITEDTRTMILNDYRNDASSAVRWQCGNVLRKHNSCTHS